MTTPEGIVKDDFRKWLDKQKVTKIWGFWPVKRVEGTGGIPDWVGLINGRFVGVEHKADLGKASTLQKLVHIAIRRAGGIIFIMEPKNFDVTIMQLEALINESVCPHCRRPRI